MFEWIKNKRLVLGLMLLVGMAGSFWSGSRVPQLNVSFGSGSRVPQFNVSFGQGYFNAAPNRPR